MTRMLLGIFLLALCLQGQPAGDVNRLHTSLAGLWDGRAQPLAEAMLTLTEEYRRPKAATVEAFASELAAALRGRPMMNAQVTQLQRPIVDVLRGSTSNVAAASRLQRTLNVLGVEASRTEGVIRRLLAIGEEVRGPDDSPVVSQK